MIGCNLVIHGGIGGDDNQVICDKDKEYNEFACFDFQAKSWMKLRQAEDNVLSIGPLGYHTMT